VDWGLNGLNATGLRTTVGLADLDVLLDEVDALNDYAVRLLVDRNNLALLATVSAALLRATGNDLNQVAFFDGSYEL